MENLFTAYNEIDVKKREALAKKLSSTIVEYLKTTKKMDEERIREFFLDVLKLSVSGDLNFSNKEYDFYKNVLGGQLNYDQVFDRTNHGANETFILEMKKQIQSYKKDVENALYSLILHILACDGPINDQEKTLFNKIYK